MKKQAELPERVIREALAPMRPDATAFEERVRAKIDKRKDEPSTTTPSASAPRISPLDWNFLRKAAGFIPPGVWENSYGAGSLTGTVQAGAIKNLLQSLLFVLALPGTFLLALVALFAGSALASRQTLGNAASVTQETLRNLREWIRQKRLTAIFTLVVLGIAAAIRPVEGLIVVLFVSMVALAAILRKLGKLGLANRAFIGEIGASMLMMLGLLGFMFHDFIEVGLASQGLPLPNLYAVFSVLMGGGMLLLLQSHGLRVKGIWLRLAAVSLALTMTTFSAFRSVPTDSEDLREFLEASIASERTRWDDFDAVAQWLVASDRASFERSSVPELLRTQLRNGETVKPEIVSIAARLGGFDRELQGHPKAILAAKEIRDAIAKRHGLKVISPWGSSHSNEAAALASGELTAEQAQELAKQILEDIQNPEPPLSLERFYNACIAIERLSGKKLPESLRLQALSMLRRSWSPTGSWYSPGGGFRNNKEVTPDTSSTLHAVNLMILFGVPQEIDLTRLHNYLVVRSRPTLFESGFQFHRAKETLALAKFESRLLPRNQEDNLGKWILDHRVLLTAIALVLLASWSVGKSRNASQVIDCHPLEPEIASFESFLRKARLASFALLGIQIVGALFLFWILGDRSARPATSSISMADTIALLSMIPCLFPKIVRTGITVIVASSRGNDRGIRTRLFGYMQSHLITMAFALSPTLLMTIELASAWIFWRVGVLAMVGLLIGLQFPTQTRMEKAVGASREEIDRELKPKG